MIRVLAVIIVIIVLAGVLWWLIKPVNTPAGELILIKSELPDGWHYQDGLEGPQTWEYHFNGLSGTYAVLSYSNESIQIGRYLNIGLYCFDSKSNAAGYLMIYPPDTLDPINGTVHLGSQSKVYFAASTMVNNTDTYLMDMTTSYVVRIDNVVLDISFRTEGPFAQEEHFREAWMDQIVKAQYDKVLEVGHFF